jgi:hypothetical protein
MAATQGGAAMTVTGGVAHAHAEHTDALLELTGLAAEDVLYTRWEGSVHHPACFVVASAARRWV